MFVLAFEFYPVISQHLIDTHFAMLTAIPSSVLVFSRLFISWFTMTDYCKSWFLAHLVFLDSQSDD